MAEREKVQFISRFVRQETVADQGKNTCYPTSVVNAAIALGAIEPTDAPTVQKKINDHLRNINDLWRGPNLNISAQDPRIAEVIENHIPVRLGIDHPNLGRLFLVPRTFTQIQRGLERGETYVIPVSEGRHAYAVIGWNNQLASLGYVDPLDPTARKFVGQETFNNTFCADQRGWVTVTPVRSRVTVLKER